MFFACFFLIPYYIIGNGSIRVEKIGSMISIKDRLILMYWYLCKTKGIKRVEIHLPNFLFLLFFKLSASIGSWIEKVHAVLSNG